LPFKCNLQRYTEVRREDIAAAAVEAEAAAAAAEAAGVGLGHFSPRYCCASKHGSLYDSQYGP
jgi:hypothetical protein